MKRVRTGERPDWQEIARREGFDFCFADGSPYWDESIHYAFTLQEIEQQLEAPTGELHALCLAAVEKVVRDENWLQRLGVPEFAWDAVAASWKAGEPSLYGRFDLAYDGTGPAKLLEYNADTPTALYETGYFQWRWLEDMLARGSLAGGTDQYNSVHDRLIARWADLRSGAPQGTILHLTCMPDSPEDLGTITYLADCAVQAGWSTRMVPLSGIGLDPDGRFRDDIDQPIRLLFKLYPWEWMLGDDYGRVVPRCDTLFIEPLWKAVLSTKGLLPLLWSMEPGHPNLLEAYFEADKAVTKLGDTYARKPVLSREGANVTLISHGVTLRAVDGPYGDGAFIRQALVPRATSAGPHTVIGSWIVADEPAGICIREDTSPVTSNLSRFVPHVILP